MSNVIIAAIVIGIASAAVFDLVVLRWLRNRPNRKFDLQPTSETPPCWPYGWPGE